MIIFVSGITINNTNLMFKIIDDDIIEVINDINKPFILL